MIIYNKYFSNEFRKSYLNEMKNTIGTINYDMLDSRSYLTLYYLFPLVEKLFVEVLKNYEDADIELYNQGTYRTIESAISKE